MTFTFTLDAFPGYLKFDRSHKVLAAIQIIEDAAGEEKQYRENIECKPSTIPAGGGSSDLG